LVTVVGVLGTFCGIAWALSKFNPVAIEASVPPLLEGMRFAFATSIAGLLISVIVKWYYLFKVKKVESAQEVGETPAEDIINQLISLNQAQQSNQDAMESSLSSIQKALTGDGETTLLTQLIRLRTGFSDKLDDLQDTLRGSLDKLAISFDDFAQTMAENNSNALIEALEEVMRDFNSKINEQFGDNFKQLNEAVGQILVWQEQYKSQMNQLAEEFSIAAASIDSSRQSLSEIAQSSSTISDCANDLKSILTGLIDARNNLEDHLDAFRELSLSATNAFPIIQSNLTELTTNFSEAVVTSTDSTQQAIQTQSQHLDTLALSTNQSMTDLSTSLESNLTELTTNFTEAVVTSTNSTQQAIQTQSQHLDTLALSTNQSMTDLSTSLESNLTELTTNFAEAVVTSTDSTQQAIQTQSQRLDTMSEMAIAATVNSTDRLSEIINNQSEGLETRFREFTAELNRNISNTIAQLLEASQEMVNSQSTNLDNISATANQALRETGQRIEETVQTNSRRMTEQIEILDRALGEELTRSLESLGTQLTRAC